MQPKDLKELEVDTTDAIFSSSQLIREQSKAGWSICQRHLVQIASVCVKFYAATAQNVAKAKVGICFADVDMGEVSSPAPPHKRPKHAQQPVTRFVRYDGSQKAAKAKTQSQHDQQATDAGASNPTAARTARGGNTIAAALSRQKQRQGQASTKGAQNRLTKQPAGKRCLLFGSAHLHYLLSTVSFSVLSFRAQTGNLSFHAPQYFLLQLSCGKQFHFVLSFHDCSAVVC